MLNRIGAIVAHCLVVFLAVSGTGHTFAAEPKSTTTTQAKQTKQVKPATSKARVTSTAKKPRVKSKKTSRAAAAKTPARAAASAPSSWQKTEQLAIKSSSALVLEQSGEASLYQKNADVVAPIASITKLMTAMVLLDGSPNLNAPITITEDDVDTLRGSRSRLHVGASLPRESALLLALMSSENRAANALARNYPGGLDAFLVAMNVKAQALGMRDTRFEDPTGLSSNNVSTAHDLAKMVMAAHRYPLIREFTTTPEAAVTISGHELAYRNTNPLVKSSDWDVSLSKTGYIQEAGKCLVMQARVASKMVVIVLLDSAGKLTRVGDANRIRRWMESVHAIRHVPDKTARSMDISDRAS